MRRQRAQMPPKRPAPLKKSQQTIHPIGEMGENTTREGTDVARAECVGRATTESIV